MLWNTPKQVANCVAAAVCVFGVTESQAAVIVDFTGFGGATSSSVNFGNGNVQVLDFVVSATGEVTLDITTTSGSAASNALADELDGVVGSVAATGSAYSFSIDVSATGNNGASGGVVLTTDEGAGVQGSGATVISFAGASSVSQELFFEVDLTGVDSSLLFQLTDVSTISSAGNPGPQITDFANTTTSLTIGANAVASDDTALAGGLTDTFSLTNANQGGASGVNGTGYSLGGFTFDITAAPDTVIPEPGSVALLSLGLTVIGLRRRCPEVAGVN